MIVPDITQGDTPPMFDDERDPADEQPYPVPAPAPEPAPPDDDEPAPEPEPAD